MARTNFYIHEAFKFSQSHAGLCLCIFYFLKWQAWPSKKKTMGCFEVENLQCAAIHYNRTVFIVLISRPLKTFSQFTRTTITSIEVFLTENGHFAQTKKQLLDQSQSSRALTNVLANRNACVTSYQFNSELDLCLKASAINWAS